MKLSALNTNALIVISGILTQTVSYLKETTPIDKAVSGNRTLANLESRVTVIKDLLAKQKQTPEGDLTEEEQTVIAEVGRHYAYLAEVILEQKEIEPGSEILSLPDMYPDVNFKGPLSEFMISTIYYAIAARTRSQKDIRTYLDYIEKRSKAPVLTPIVKAINRYVEEYVAFTVDKAVAREFGEYLKVENWKGLVNAVEDLVNKVNAAESKPAANEVRLTLEEFDRINNAVDALYGSKPFSRVEDLGNGVPLPHYTRGNIARNPTIVLKIVGSGITDMSFSGL